MVAVFNVPTLPLPVRLDASVWLSIDVVRGTPLRFCCKVVEFCNPVANAADAVTVATPRTGLGGGCC